MSIYSKILETQKKVGYVSKNGRNDFHKYDYATEADILDSVKKAANECGLILTTSATSETGFREISKGFDREGNPFPPDTVRWAKVDLAYKVIDAESGEAIEGNFPGYAEDKNDKALYKAMTGANKYFLMKFFGVATGDDPEKEEAPKPQPAPAQRQKPAAVPQQDRVVENPRTTCKRNYDQIQAILKANGWTAKEFQEITGLESGVALLNAGTLEAAEVLGKAYLQLVEAGKSLAERQAS